MHKLFNTKKTIFTLIMSLFIITNKVSALSCGDIIMTDTVMTEDLYCPWTVGSGLHALEFGNDNITLDMNGHSISGENGTMSNIKIAVISHKNITIKNGSIVDSTFPIQILNSESIYIKDITFYNVSFIGIYSSNSTKVYIENNDFYYVETGVHVYNNSMLESTNSISKNQFYKNTNAIALYNSNMNTISGNFIWKSTTTGISLDESNENLIIKNDILNTEIVALHLNNSSKNRITSNKLNFSTTGLALLGNFDNCNKCISKNNTFNYNYVLNSKTGIDLGGLSGSGVVSNNTLKGNKIYDNETGIYFRSNASYNSTSNGFQGTVTPIIDEGTGNTY